MKIRVVAYFFGMIAPSYSFNFFGTPCIFLWYDKCPIFQVNYQNMSFNVFSINLIELVKISNLAMKILKIYKKWHFNGKFEICYNWCDHWISFTQSCNYIWNPYYSMSPLPRKSIIISKIPHSSDATDILALQNRFLGWNFTHSN